VRKLYIKKTNFACNFSIIRMTEKLNSIEEAIDEFKHGRIIIVVDDENRENEGDFICAAQNISPEIVNFMATHGRGLICAPVNEKRCEELGLDMMVAKNRSTHETAFTISVDLLGHGCTTGISASDRAKTFKAIANPKTKPNELGRPGHIFPLNAKNDGVLQRAGHTEATVDLARLAGLYPVGALVEIMNEDGTMARLPELFKIAKKFKLKIISIQDLIAYRIKNESLISKEVIVDLPTKWGNFKLHAYRQITNNNNHIGVPLTLFSTTNDYDILILELGTNHFGEIAYTANIAQPDYAIITNIGNSQKLDVC